MLFGFLFLDILLWFILPVLLLVFLASDSQWWAAFAVVFMIAVFGHTYGWSYIIANVTDPVWIGNALQYIFGYVLLGLVFSFLKWKVLATKAATSFREYISGMDFTAKVLAGKNPGRNLDGKELKSQNLDYPTIADLVEIRTTTANEWSRNSWGTNRLIAVETNESATGWVTKYEKLRLTGYVTAWTIYWPFYTLLLVVDDFIRHIFTWFVEHFGKLFQRIADASFSDIK